MRYALYAYAVSWVVVGAVSAQVFEPVGLRVPSGAGALSIDVAWLATLLPLYRSGRLRAVDLGLRTVPISRSAVLAVLTFLLAALFDALWARTLGLSAPSNPFSSVSREGVVAVVVTGVAVVASPVAEEIFFRGLLYRCFRNRFAVPSASLIVGVMFGLIHTQYQAALLPELAIYGVLVCLLYEYTGSLLPAIATDMYLDVGAFEHALTGRDTVVLTCFGLLIPVLLLRRRLSKSASGR